MPTYSPDGQSFWDEANGRWLPVPPQQGDLLPAKVRPSARGWFARQPGWFLASIGGGAAALVLVGVGGVWLTSGSTASEATPLPVVSNAPVIPTTASAPTAGVTAAAPTLSTSTTPAYSAAHVQAELTTLMRGCWNTLVTEHGHKPADPDPYWAASDQADAYMAQLDWYGFTNEALDCVQADSRFACHQADPNSLHLGIGPTDYCEAKDDSEVHLTWLVSQIDFDSIVGNVLGQETAGSSV